MKQLMVHETQTVLSANEQRTEQVLMGLRLARGIELKSLEQSHQRALSPEGVRQMQDLGFLDISEGRIFVKKQHFNVLNAILEKIIPD